MPVGCFHPTVPVGAVPARTRFTRHDGDADGAALGPDSVGGVPCVARLDIRPAAVPGAPLDGGPEGSDDRSTVRETGPGGRRGSRYGVTSFFRQYRASPLQFKSNRPATSYACASAWFIRRVNSFRSSSANHASRSASVPSRANERFARTLVSVM